MKKPFGQSSNPFSSQIGAAGVRSPGAMSQVARPTAPASARSRENESFREFAASELYCPKCGVAMPVKEKPLLYLPTGAVSDYKCARCGTVLGTKRS